MKNGIPLKFLNSFIMKVFKINIIDLLDDDYSFMIEWDWNEIELLYY